MAPTNATRPRPRRLAGAIAGIALGTVAGRFVTDVTWRILTRPFHRPGASLLDHAPGAFLPQLKLSLIFGLVVASPIWLSLLFGMIAPRTDGAGRRRTVLFLALPLFAIGCVLAYLTLYESLWPAGGGEFTVITDSDYLDLAMARLLVFGLAMELPLFAVVAGRERRRTLRSA